MEVLFRLRMLDFMAPPVMLNMGGDKGIKTVFGFVMSICYIGVLIALAVVIALSFFDTSNPSIAQQQTESGVYPRISLADNKMVPVLYVFQNTIYPTKPQDILRYITPLFAKQKFYLKPDEKGVPQTFYEFVPMPMVPCGELMKDEAAYQLYKDYENTEFFAKYAKDYGLCIKVNETEAFVQGGGTDGAVDMLTMNIYPCSLASGCASFEEIVQVGLVLSFPTYSLNFSSYDKPVTPYLTGDNIYYIDPKTRGKYSNKLSINEVWDDRGLFFENRLKKNYSEVARLIPGNRYRNVSQLTCTMKDILAEECLVYFNFEFMSSGRKVIISRTYKSLTQTVSEIGGINSICFVFFFYINLVYMEKAKKKILANHIFEFLDKPLFDKNNKGGASKSDAKQKPSKSAKQLQLDKKKAKELEEEACKVVEKSLDVVTIVKEINTLKVLTHLLLKDYHLKLVPALALSLQLAASQKPKEEGGAKEQETGYTGYANEGDLDFGTALKMVAKRHAQQEGKDKTNPNLEEKVDKYCYEVLSKSKIDLNLDEDENVHNWSDFMTLFGKSNSSGANPEDSPLRYLFTLPEVGIDMIQFDPAPNIIHSPPVSKLAPPANLGDV